MCLSRGRARSRSTAFCNKRVALVRQRRNSCRVRTSYAVNMGIRIRPLFLLLAFAVLALAGSPLRAQVSPSMDTPNTPTRAPEQQSNDADKPAAQEEAPQKTFKVGTSIVNLFFTVRDKSGVPDATMTQGDCSVMEDKQPRQLKNFGLVKD